MKKVIVSIILLLSAIFLVNGVYAFDWEQAESGRDNIRLEGYKSQPGYIAFENGDGETEVKLFAHDDKLYYYTGVTHDSDLETLCATAGGSERSSCYLIGATTN